MAFLLLKWRETAIAALLSALLLTIALYTASGKRKDARIETLVGEVKAEQVAHAVTRQSVAMLQAAVEAQNRDASARADQYAAIKAADASDQRKHDEAARGESVRQATFAGIAKAAGGAAGSAACKVPPALLASLDGL